MRNHLLDYIIINKTLEVMKLLFKIFFRIISILFTLKRKDFFKELFHI